MSATPQPCARLTIASAVSLEGIGLHLGKACRLTFRPARAGDGIAFIRADRPSQRPMRASIENAREVARRTQLGDGDDAVHTVEHVLAAVAAAEIDDLRIELDGPEPPVLDGSAGPFFRALQNAGIVAANGANGTAALLRPTVLSLQEPLRIDDGDSWYEAHPSGNLALDITIDFPHPMIGTQRCLVDVKPDSFARDLADARTFGFTDELESLREAGLIKGGSIENAIVLDSNGDGMVTGGSELRWPDEFVRHKALDCVGDLALAGARIRARIVAHRPSHRGTIKLVRELLRQATKETCVLGIEDIMKVIPHRYPFLLVDRILELEPGKRVVGIKNVTINEPFFAGHFPGHPIMPGVLIIEAMAQVGGMLLMGSIDVPESKVVYFISLDNVKWRKPVKPGDQLRFELDVVQLRGVVCKMRGIAKVEGEVVAEADMAAMLRDR
ncbi:MAG TPA: UDP-3-O-acyl-N-acetylglucosamine deacetylase [Gemmatimonadaceae bacterium]|nr:UDP-3-O-acyl-N-acetylglucosamine deacetylase [Gemmatimonadaceae bacterium]